MGIASATVLLYDPLFFLPPVRPAVGTARSGEDGRFQLAAPAGSYLLVARLGDHFSFFGRNPVRLSRPIGNINLPLVPAYTTTRSAVEAGNEGIKGRVLHAGEALAAARVFIYLDPARGFRGPGYALSEPTEEDGRFHIPLPPGTYFVVARHRPRGWKTGGLEPGDHFGVLPELPLILAQGERADLTIETVEVPSQEQMARYQGRSSVLSGRVVDQHGRPLSDLRACLYSNPQMLDRPLAVSESTGSDGRFSLKTDQTGTLYLGARETLGGPPGLNERVGFYRGPAGSVLELTPEQRREDLTIVVQVRR